MKKKYEDTILGLSLAVSGVAHLWFIGLGYHFVLEKHNLGPWFYVPASFTMMFTWVVLAVCLATFADHMGWCDDESPPPQLGMTSEGK